jgi:hypothetical protein
VSTLHKDHRDILLAPVVSEKSYSLLDANKTVRASRWGLPGKGPGTRLVSLLRVRRPQGRRACGVGGMRRPPCGD